MRIVVVDDEPALVKVMTRMISRALGSNRYEIIGAHTLDEAVAALRGSSMSWLVTDFDLGGQTTGCCVVSAALAADVPLKRVAIVSGRLTPDDHSSLSCAVPFQVHSKPLSKADCEAMLGWLLAA